MDGTGAVYVFERVGTGAWTEGEKLVASDGKVGDDFGGSVDLDGDRMVVGASEADDLGNGAGKAYVFDRDGGGSWLEVAKLFGSDQEGGDDFGSSVAISGDRVVVGADQHDHGFAGTGAGYAFERQPDGSWIEVEELLAADRGALDFLGRSAAMEGATVVLGAPFESELGLDAGAAWVFQRVDPRLAVTGACPGEIEVALTGATPNRPAALWWSSAEGVTPLPPPCAGEELGLEEARPLGVRRADGRGEVVLTRSVGAGACGLLLQAVDGSSCLVSGVAAVP